MLQNMLTMVGSKRNYDLLNFAVLQFLVIFASDSLSGTDISGP